LPIRERFIGAAARTAGVDEESWRADRAREFAELRGRHVTSWIGVEFALREDVPGIGPQFHDPQVPCLQLSGLQAMLDDGGLFTVGTYEHYVRDAVCGLWRHQEFDGRIQEVDEVTVYGDEGVLAEVLLVIGGRPLLLMAGELYETWTDDLGVPPARRVGAGVHRSGCG
jgi:hypothetical protein